MDKRIAVIGYSLRLPGCDNTETLWEALLNKRDLVTEVSEERWSKEAWLHPDQKHPGSSYSFAAGSIGDVSGFDAAFFGLSPREVTHMDPQQRLLLEMSWEAMEHACIAPSSLRGSNTGVFMGIASADYGYRFTDDFSAIDANTATGTAPSIASNRISYLFDLKGPSISMDTACSSSMVAFHQACQSILNGEVDQALTGGVSLHLHPFGFMIFAKATMLSPDGQCRVFDADGNGYVRSEGGGVFLLKDYDKAVADNDPIVAVVAASAVNTDGYKSGLTVPNPVAQVALMHQACARAGITAEQIDYLEAHGTGTRVGDPIETSAIGEALGQSRSKPLKIGSIKSNVGHLETASGVAGLAKALLSIEHRQVPATISMKTPNPNIDFDAWNIEVVTDTLELPKTGQITIGVNSFGFGGANAHVILQSPPELDSVITQKSAMQHAATASSVRLPLMLSARSAEALKGIAQRTAEQLNANQDIDLYDLCWSARYRREQHEQALLVWSDNREQTIAALQAFADESEHPDVFTGRRSTQERSSQDHRTEGYSTHEQGSVWVYSGNGCQWAGMGLQLMNDSQLVRETVVEINQLIKQYTDDCNIEELLGHAQDDDCYALTELAQPALFALQVAVTRYLQAQGLQPAAVIGHSVGEVAAAWASGALTLEQATQVICLRSYYQGKTAGSGEMTAVAANAERIEALLSELDCDQVALAGINSAKGITLAGNPAQLAQIEAVLKSEGVRFKRLSLNYAFHSAYMDPIEQGLKDALANLQPDVSRVAFLSTVTGGELEGTALNADYWWQNIRRPVLFEAAVNSCLQQGLRTFIEIGAHPVLRGYLNDCLRTQDLQGQVITTLARNDDGCEQLERAGAELILSGAKLDESHWFPVQGQVLALPAYPWQKQRYWKVDSSESLGLLSRHYLHPLLGYALPQQPGHWEVQMDTGRQPWLADHNVGGGVVFPGAGFVELVLAAVEQQLQLQELNPAVIDIENLEIRAPLLLEAAASKVVRTHLNENSGDLHVSARPYAQEGGWQEHVKARWFAGSAGRLLTRNCTALPERSADYSLAEHLAAASSIGLEYGPAFQAVDAIWIDGSSVIARCEPSASIKDTHTELLLHPGVLDAAFQLFIPLLAQEQQQDGFGYVPVQIGRLQFSRAHIGTLPAHIRVHLKRRSPHSLLAEVELFDAQGVALAVLTDVRFKAVALRKKQALAISKLSMPLQSKPLPHEASLLDAKALLEAWRALFVEQSSDVLLSEVEPLLDTLVLTSLNDSFTAQATRTTQLGDAQQRWVIAAQEQGLLIENAAGYLQVSDAPEVGTQQLWELLVREYPAAFVLTHAVGRFSLHLGEWLNQTGSLPELNEQLWSDIYRTRYDAARLTRLQNHLAEALTEQLKHLQPEQRLCLAEITAGEMLFTPALAAAIQGRNAELSFVSASAAATNEARTQLQGHIELQALHWTEKTLPVELGMLDLAIVHLDFMQPAQVLELLQQLRSQLRVGAQLLLLGQPHALWLQQLHAGQSHLLEQEEHVQPSSEYWQQQLSILGFTVNDLLEDNLLPSSAFLISASPAQQLNSELAECDCTYLIWTDAYSQSLADQLQSIAPRSQQINDLAGLQAQLAVLAEPELNLHLVLLAGAWSDDARSLATQRCALIRDVVVALDASGFNLPITVVTAGVGAARLNPDALPDSADLVAQAAVWGFVRTLMNEAALPLQLLDVPDAFQQSAKTLDVHAIEHALRCAAQEDEQYLNRSGQRYVPRLLEVQAQSALAEHNAHSSITLGFTQPGQLRNLCWQPHDLAALGENEVLIDVKATGLNFRDVMYALGLLSDEAIENGFSGPTLGLEFAGQVAAVGVGVTEFRAGEKVVGFGPASFSTRLITSTETIAHLPGEISFEAAATIPTTFFTVYYALKHLARLQPGERVLIHGAAGGVGLAAIQVARLMGAEIFATVGSPSKRDVMKLLGITAIYGSRSDTFAEDILADTQGEGVDVVLNSLAGEAINQNLRVLRPFGRFLELGKRDFYENTAVGLRPFRNNISYFGIDSDQLMKVQPALTRTLFREMMALFEQGELYPLPYTAFAASRVVGAFRYMQQAKQIGKVVVNYPQLPDVTKQSSVLVAQTPLELQLPADKTFLVTGGLGGFGLRTAQWLVEKGAKHLALLSRRGQAEAEDALIVDQLRSAGVDVQTYACDVSQREQLAATLQRIEAQQPVLAGVVHAATVFADALVQNMSDEQIEQVLAAKAFGAQYLHELTAGKPLEFFVMFSSATTLFGNPGQANYVGANLSLEALTQLRCVQGLAATCVRWGPIDDAGYLARNSQIKQMLQSRLGGQALSTANALAVLEQMLINGESLLGVMEFDWSALSRSLPNAGAARYQLIARSHEVGDANDHSGDLVAELLHLTPEQQLERVVQELKHSLSQILMLPIEQIDPDQALYDLGLDSLMGVELITAIEDRFSVQLPAMLISESPSITKLSIKLLERLGSDDTTSEELTLTQVAAQHGISEQEVQDV